MQERLLLVLDNSFKDEKSHLESRKSNESMDLSLLAVGQMSNFFTIVVNILSKKIIFDTLLQHFYHNKKPGEEKRDKIDGFNSSREKTKEKNAKISFPKLRIRKLGFLAKQALDSPPLGNFTHSTDVKQPKIYPR